MTTTTLGARYRNKITGLTGTATGQAVDPEGVVIGGRKVSVALTRISLDPEHVAEHNGQNNRWHPDDDLDEDGAA